MDVNKKIEFDGTQLKQFITEPQGVAAEAILISRQQLSNIIKGRKKPSVDVLVRLCRRYAIPIDALTKVST